MDNQNITNNNFEQIHIEYIEKMFSKFNFYYPEKTKWTPKLKKAVYGFFVCLFFSKRFLF